MKRRAIATIALLLSTLLPSAGASAALVPSQWPEGIAIGTAPNAIRFGGIDRYHTSLAMTLALHGTGGYPFESPDRTAGAWWGAATCPSAAIIVAGDTPADALAAASLSDPTDRSNQPRLTRVASADPEFDVVGETDRVDTGAAPIIVTESTRSGATALSEPARLALEDLVAGGCSTAREAIIVGGEAAVPGDVEDQLLFLGYEEIFRVAGADRYDTAARIAVALGTETSPPGTECTDPTVSDGDTRMGFHGNAIVEYRADAQSCTVLNRTVVLADGLAGVDALAAGWWTSYWQVPVLLTGAGGALPPATRTALQSIDIDAIVVLGGTGRIPESTVDEAKRLASAVVGRFAGADRYETSVVMARVFGGWHDTGDAADYVGDRVCVAASGGTSATVGWPDALAAGPWCGRLAANQRSSPSRVLEPVERADGPVPAVPPAHDAVPVLLVPAGSTSLPSRVADLLAKSFLRGARWCRGGSAADCRMPGFAVAFGGAATVTDLLVARASSALAGADAAQRGAEAGVALPFRTQLDLRPVFADIGGSATARACLDRGGVNSARWLALYEDPALTTFVMSADLVAGDAYESDSSIPLCIPIGVGLNVDRSLVALSTSGEPAAPVSLPRVAPGDLTSLSDAIVSDSAETFGEPGPSIAGGAITRWALTTDRTRTTTSHRGQTWDVATASLDVAIARGEDGTTGRFLGDVVLDDGNDLRIVARIDGDARKVGDTWELAGRFVLDDAIGGFRASIATQGTDAGTDDVATWSADAIRA